MSQNTKEEFAERRAADLKLKSSAYNGYVGLLLCNVGPMNKEYVGFVKCTTCSKVMKHDIHSSSSTHLLLHYNSLECAHFCPNKHGLCRAGRGARGLASTHPTCGCGRFADLYRYYSCGRGPSADRKLRMRIIRGREICGSAHLC